MSNSDRPCYGCDRRTERCHITCEDYKKFRANLDEKKSAIEKEKDKERVMNRYLVDNYRKRVWKK